MNLLTLVAVGVVGYVAYDIWMKSKMPTRTSRTTTPANTATVEEEDLSFMSSGLFDSECPNLANGCALKS
jgi:uncharacterized membrane protein YebE (DUF533 family)